MDQNPGSREEVGWGREIGRNNNTFANYDILGLAQRYEHYRVWPGGQPSGLLQLALAFAEAVLMSRPRTCAPGSLGGVHVTRIGDDLHLRVLQLRHQDSRLTQDEVRRLFAVITGTRDRALFQLAYHHGLRASEVSLPQRENLHARLGCISIPRVKGSVATRGPDDAGRKGGGDGRGG
jgi:integrase